MPYFCKNDVLVSCVIINICVIRHKWIFSIRCPALGESWEIVWPAYPGYYVIAFAAESFHVTANLCEQSGQLGQL